MAEADERAPAPDDPGASLIPTQRAATPAPGGGTRTAVPRWTISQFPQLADETMPAVKGLAPAAAEGDAPTYELRRVVGRGGMGEVWEAYQGSLRRLVAVKMIRSDAWRSLAEDPPLRDMHLRAFEQEAYMTALLDHPNIVPVYDLGAAAADGDGPPVLAMKLVEGEAWHKMLAQDLKVLEPAAFLQKHLPILEDMAQAVAFAHSRGIVHRDLKPQQVMVGKYGETLLMDWGLAVFVGSEASDSVRPRLSPNLRGELPTPGTATSPAGTPSMMAPEQAAETADGVGTWTDVFLLGGTLYYILTGGGVPHESRTSAAAMNLALRGDIVPPSQRAPGREIPPELEALCLHALQRRPEDRVASADEFVARLRDYMTGAGRRRESEKAQAAAAADFAALERDAAGGRVRALDLYLRHGAIDEALGRALELWPGNAAARALRAKNLAARLEGEIAHGDLLLARVHLGQLGADPAAEPLAMKLDEAERRRTAHRRQRTHFAWAAGVLFLCSLAFAVVSRINAERATRNLAIANEQGRGSQQLVLFVLDQLRDELDRQLDAAEGLKGSEANAIRHRIGEAVGRRIADYFETLKPQGWPRELQLELAERESEAGIRLYRFGSNDAAERLIRGALALREAIFGAESAEYASSLSFLSAIERARGDFDRATKFARRVLEIRRKVLGPDDEMTAAAKTDLGELLHVAGNLDEAEPLLREAVEFFGRQKSPRTDTFVNALSNLAALLRTRGKFDDSEALYQKALALRVARSGDESVEAATIRQNLGVLLSERGKHAEALPLFEQSLAAFAQHYGPESDSAGRAHLNVADALETLERNAEAIPHAEAAVRLLEGALSPDAPDLLTAKNTYARVLGGMGRGREAVRMLEEVLAARSRSLGATHRSVGDAHNAVAVQQYANGDYAPAAGHFAEALAIWRPALGPDHPRVATGLGNLSASFEKLERYGEAAAIARELISLRERTAGARSTEVAAALLKLAGVQAGSGDHGAARETLANALAIEREAKGPDTQTVAEALQAIARIEAVEGCFLDSEGPYRQAADIFGAEKTRSPVRRATALAGVALALMETGRPDAAEGPCRESLELREAALGPRNPATMQSLVRLAQIQVARRQWEEAESLLDAALKRGGDPVPALLALAELELERGRPEVAMRYVEPLPGAMAEDSGYRGEMWYLLGRAQSALGMAAAAAASLEKSLETARQARFPNFQTIAEREAALRATK